MAEHKVQLPDNSVITIEGPEDATDQELIDAASQHYANKQAQNSGPISAIAQTVDNARNMGGLAYGAGAAGLAGLGALALGGKSLKDKFFSAEKPIERVEPQMDVNQQKPSEPYLEPETTPQGTDWESKLSPQDRELLQKSRENAAAKAQSSFPGNIAPAGENVVPQTQMPVTGQTLESNKPPVNLPLTPVSPVGAQESMNRAANMQGFTGAGTPNQDFLDAIKERQALPPVTPTTTTSVVEVPKVAAPSPDVEEKLGKPTLITGSGMPAYEGQGAEGSKLKHKEGKFASLNDIPKGTVFVPGGNYMDTLRNATGQPAYTQNLKSTGGYPASNEATAAQARAINASLNRPTREQAIAQGLSLGENTPPITLKVNKKKIVTVAGVTGALVLLPDLANAAQNQDATSAGKLSNTAGALGLATMMARGVPPTLPTLGQSIGGRSVNMNPDFLSQLLR